MSIFGLRFIINDYMGLHIEYEQVRFPRSKKRRIRKKWAKQGKNFKTRTWQEPQCVRMGDVLFMNSAMKAELDKKAHGV